MPIWQYQSTLHPWSNRDGTLTDQARLWLNALFKTVTTQGTGPVQLGGDIGGTSVSPLVIGLQGNPIAAIPPADGQVLAWDGAANAWEPSAEAAGTVTSVGLSMPPEFTVANSPITAAGTIGVGKAPEPANTHYAGPAIGAPAPPTFRALVVADLPAGTGTVSSVGLTMPAEFTVTNSPVTGAGAIAVTKAPEPANTLFAGPATGAPAAPTFRALTAADFPAGAGTVSSVGLAAPTEFTVTGSPVTGVGVLTFTKANQAANTLYAGPATGAAAAPAFRALAAADVPQVIKVNNVLVG